MLKKIWNHEPKKKRMGLNLLKYFTDDRRALSPAYVKSCEKFLKEISSKLQATSGKLQASSLKRHEKNTIINYKEIRKE